MVSNVGARVVVRGGIHYKGDVELVAFAGNCSPGKPVVDSFNSSTPFHTMCSLNQFSAALKGSV